MNEWSNYFIAMTGAAAGLTGLLFVGLSINLTKILSISKLANRALGALILLITVLILSSLCLVPGQPLIFIGIETLIVSISIFCILITLDLKMLKATTDKENKRYALQNLMLSQLSVFPYFISGISICFCGSKGIYWLIPGIIFSICKALLDAWVLLIEINR